ncbi:hypothetical protein TcasGA2_TC015997 [Tribolium castaneum]|uniref:Uncharacterized protein n=1 Tax=Tribolium castaneum TaxID=7070 RepID=D7GXJ9_TRICA|nr:hypothetical protein TcasGA2_TC005024 [Tribolium castaneum]EFA13417.1 hypothetical protein TcasGA2_TC015997 [Tribolium castaneum]
MFSVHLTLYIVQTKYDVHKVRK